MKRSIFIIKFILFIGIMNSCQQEEILSNNRSTGSGQTNKISENKDGIILADRLPDDPEGGGGGGGGGTQPQVVPNGALLFLPGKSKTAFSSSGNATTDMVGINYADVSSSWFTPYDYLQDSNVNVTWFWLGAMAQSNNISYIAQAYPIGYAPGYGLYFVNNARVRVISFSSGGVSPADMDQYYAGDVSAISGPNTAQEGRMTITNFEITSSGRLNLSYTLTVGNKTFNFTKQNYARMF